MVLAALSLGEWRMIELVQNGKVLTSVPYFAARSRAVVTPTQVRVGQQFKVEVKDIGWTGSTTVSR